MTAKKETFLKREKIKHIRQIFCMILMIIAGLYYITYGRAEQEAPVRIEFETESIRYEETSAQSVPVEQNEEEIRREEAETERDETEETERVQPTKSTKLSTEAPEMHSQKLSLNAKRNAKININTATREELTSLPGIGPATAERIIQYREANGMFMETAELQNVKRIGEKTYLKLKDLVTVG